MLRWFNIIFFLFIFSQTIVNFIKGEIMNMAERGQPPARLKFSASRSITMKTSSITTSKEPKINQKYLLFLWPNKQKITFEHSKISAAIEIIFWVLVYLSSTPNELSTQLTRYCLARIIGTKQILLRPIWTRHKSFRSESFFLWDLKNEKQK